ncbi:MAG TPA: hypothetical protein VIO11_07820 [Candidatus Methanoperedens sp.]
MIFADFYIAGVHFDEALSSCRNDIIGKLRIQYPEQILEAERKFYEFFKGNFEVSLF